MKKVESFEQACEILGRLTTLPDVSHIPSEELNERQAHISLYKLTVIIAATNKINDWKANWNDHGQRKYYPWMEVNADDQRPSGFGLSYLDFGHTSSGTTVGSRHCVGTWEMAQYIGETFIDLYTDWMLIQ